MPRHTLFALRLIASQPGMKAVLPQGAAWVLRNCRPERLYCVGAMQIPMMTRHAFRATGSVDFGRWREQRAAQCKQWASEDTFL